MTAEPQPLFELRPETVPTLLVQVLHTVDYLLSANQLMADHLAQLHVLLSAARTALVPQVPSEPERPPEEHTEADPPYQGWRPGDPVNIQTMGGSQ